MTFARVKTASQPMRSSAGSVASEPPGEAPQPRAAMRGMVFKNVGVLFAALVLASVGVYNIVLKASWAQLDDGVFWREAPEGLVAAQVAHGQPGALAGVEPGDILLALDGEDV